MRRTIVTRVLVLLLCVAVMSLLASGSGGAPFAALLAPFLILFATLPVWRANPHRDSDGRGQSLSYFSLDAARAPPAV